MIDANVLNRKGADLWLQGDAAAARAHYLAALTVNPDYIPALANLAVMAGEENNLIVAETLFRRLTKIDPANGHHWNNLGNILARQEKFEDATIAFEYAEKLMPENPGFWHNKALMLYRTHNYITALRCLEKVEALGGLSPAVENDIAHVLLALGNLESALEKYEARWASLLHLQPWDYHIPEWRGENLAGKHILFHAEQGFGDTIMTARFIKDLQNLGARVTIGLPPALLRLFEFQDWNCLNINELTESRAKEFDFHSPMYSAMRWLEVKKDEIISSPYIFTPDLVVPGVSHDVFNIGICWASGKRGGQHDWRRRHAPLELWLPLAAIPSVQLYSLQKGEENEDISRLGAEALIYNPSSAFDDWAETAAFISQLDLVISVDTAVVHLAGAMGKSVWMLSQYSNCWRWWDISGGTGQPWYENVSIISQDYPGDWESQLKVAKIWLDDYFRIRIAA